jgi:hypothetical protein
MLIRFIGPRTRRRLWGPYVFERENGYVQEVSAETAAAMLTHPGNDFAVADEDGLAQTAGLAMAELLALEGIGDVEALASVNVAQQKRLARALGVTRREMGTWMQAGMMAMAEGGSSDAKNEEVGI